jgi:hypothetical protein
MTKKDNGLPRYDPLLYPEHAKELLALSVIAIPVLIPLILALHTWHPRSWISILAAVVVWEDLLLLGLGILNIAWSINDSQEYHDCDQLCHRTTLSSDFDLTKKMLRRMQKHDAAAWIHEYRGMELCKSGLIGALGILIALPLALTL